MPAAAKNDDSWERVETWYATEDDRFLDAVGELRGHRPLAAFADLWAVDPRPWARAQIFRYLERPFDRPGHEPVVKRLFKAAEAQADDELMAAFLVAFDRLVRRQRRQVSYWDPRSRQLRSVERLFTPRNTIPHGAPRFRNRGRPRPAERLFSYRTRYYLRRRAWRYFRRLRHARPAAYPMAVAAALKRYTDDDLIPGEHLLESWGLIHCCFGEHDALEIGSTNIRLAPGASIGQLEPAPMYSELWRTRDAVGVLVAIAAEARSKLVRVWAMELAAAAPQAHFDSLSNRAWQTLLEHEDEEVQQFGLDAMKASGRLATLQAAEWLQLIDAAHVAVLPALCDLMRRHVEADQLSFEACVTLATARASPVAEAGFHWLQQQTVGGEHSTSLAELADAACPTWGEPIACWALEQAVRLDILDLEFITRFFDSRLKACRVATWDWLRGRGENLPPGVDLHPLWLRLMESPYADVREGLVDELARRKRTPPISTEDLNPLWATVLLGVYRGGRQKRKVTAQLAERIIREPAEAGSLLPLLAVAVRSVRTPEMRSGLAAVARVATRRPELRELIARLLPEIEIEIESEVL